MKGFVKTKPVVLGDRALVRKPRVVSPPPDEFTHTLLRRAPYYFTTAKRASRPDGYLAKGTKVLLLARRKGARCHVADERGRVLDVGCEALRKLG
jgi:hypothetical protein